MAALLVFAPHLAAPQGSGPLKKEQASPASRPAENRVALVIGNGSYTNTSPLRNAPNDAHEVAATLQSLGFDVVSGINLKQRDMKRLLRDFGKSLKAGGTGLFYYAGHGVQSKGHNYLIPIDADIQSETDVEDTAVDVNLVLEYMDEAQNGLNFVILDACRNNPFARSFRSASDGLAQVDAPTGTLIAYATAPGRVASDGMGENGLYTSELLKQMRVPGLSVTEMFMRVRAAVIKQTGGKQVPWEASSLVGTFSFNATKMESVTTNNASVPEQRIQSGHLTEVTSNPSANSNGTVETRKLDLSIALRLLDRSIEARDGSLQGQIEAIESLLVLGYEFSGKDLSGVSLRAARLTNGIFTKVRMHGGDLSKVDARGANFADSGLRFVNLENASFREAVFTNSYAPFVWAKDVNFEKANLSKSNFFCADLRGANFKDGNLRGASFAFADLRGAKFDGADLTGAYLPGAVLDDATFINTIVDNTDFTGAVAETFGLSPKQLRGACKHPSEGELHIAVYRSGDSYPFNSILDWYPFSATSLPLCTTEPLDLDYNAAKDGYRWNIYLDRAPVSRAGREELFRDRVSAHKELLKTHLIASKVLKR